MIPDFPETSEIELPFAIAETITSWRRIFVGQDGADPRSLLRHAAADLWKTIEINQMVHPESHGAARQEAVDALQDMAEIGGIGPDDAQFIFAESFRASASDAAEAKKPNGGGRPHQPPVEVRPTMDDAAYHGLAGDVVKTIRPHTESDPVAILIQFLTCFGNVIGHAAYYQVESDRHHANLFAALVGQSSKARKGTAMGRVSAVAKIADNRWFDDRMKGGLSSGEGLITEVRDEIKKWDAKSKTFETVDPGVTDKRLMVSEAEFASALAVMERHGNTLSPVIRKAWDGGKLATLTRSSPLCATGGHISIVGHITEDELRSRITRTDMANGFAHRFLFALIKRSKELPFGGDLSDSEIQHLGERLAEAVEFAQTVGRVTLTDSAKAEWARVYSALSAGQPGLLGAITARAEAQAVRLAMIYALLDRQHRIDGLHLKAALAVWEYCEASAAHIFGNALGDHVADEILRALQQVGENGMTRTAIRDLFARNQSGDRIGAALAMLMTKGRARMEGRESGGRPVEVWFATAAARHG